MRLPYTQGEGFPGGSVVKSPPAVQEPQETQQVRYLDWKDPLEEEKATHFIILVWEIPWILVAMPSSRQSSQPRDESMSLMSPT